MLKLPFLFIFRRRATFFLFSFTKPPCILNYQISHIDKAKCEALNISHELPFTNHPWRNILFIFNSISPVGLYDHSRYITYNLYIILVQQSYYYIFVCLLQCFLCYIPMYVYYPSCKECEKKTFLYKCEREIEGLIEHKVNTFTQSFTYSLHHHSYHSGVPYITLLWIFTSFPTNTTLRTDDNGHVK